jgi:hypothetical protein
MNICTNKLFVTFFKSKTYWMDKYYRRCHCQLLHPQLFQEVSVHLLLGPSGTSLHLFKSITVNQTKTVSVK